MKRIALCLLFLTIAFAPAITGCKSSPQRVSFQTAATTGVTVEAALHAYDVFAEQGKTTPAQNLAVKQAFIKYQSAFAVLCDAGAAYAAATQVEPNGTTSAAAAAFLQQAALNSSATITDILTLIQSFGIKL